MKEITKQRLIKRLSWYYPTEFFNAFFFTGVALYVLLQNNFSETYTLIFGLGLMIFILFQGAHYWKLKLKSLKGDLILQAGHVERFRSFKKQNEILIFISISLLAFQFSTSHFKFNRENLPWWTLAANIFGILEYINYYHRQLMIDNFYDIRYVIKNRKLKVPSLKRDLILLRRNTNMVG